jgi:nucleotide-binding universal stress UspA family protein
MALRYAATLARRSRARLAAVFAVDPFLSTAAAAAYDTRALAGTSLLELRRFVRATLGPTAATAARCEVVVGRPSPALVATAERLHADLLVLGTHGLSGVKKIFFGSTTDAILRRATLPVLAIPRKCRAPRRNWPEAGVVAAIHFDNALVQEAAAAADVAATLGVALDLIVTVPDVRLPFWVRVNRRTFNRQRLARAQSWLDKRLTIASSAASADTHVLVGDKAEDLTRFAAGLGADALIVTVPRAYHLLCVARCPVLVLPRLKVRSRLADVA